MADLLTAKAAAKKLGVSPDTFRKFVAAGAIPPWYGPGRTHPLFSVAELDDVLRTVGRDQAKQAS